MRAPFSPHQEAEAVLMAPVTMVPTWVLNLGMEMRRSQSITSEEMEVFL